MAPNLPNSLKTQTPFLYLKIPVLLCLSKLVWFTKSKAGKWQFQESKEQASCLVKILRTEKIENCFPWEDTSHILLKVKIHGKMGFGTSKDGE